MSNTSLPNSMGQHHPLTDSYVCGTAQKPLLYQTIGGCLQEQAQRSPNALALVVRHQGIRWTYQELYSQVEQAARGLMALGLKPGERVGIWAPNCVEWVITQFATAMCGLILVNINPAYRTHELTYVLQKVGCKALITARAFKKSNYIAMLQEVIPELAVCPPGELTSHTFPHLSWVIALNDPTHTQAQNIPGMLAFSTLLSPQHSQGISKQALQQVLKSLNPDDAINIQFTSGTTGFPKGATLTHFNILNNGYFVAEGMQFSAQDKLCIPVPLYHCMGMVMGNLGCITHGAAMVFPSDGFDPEAVLAAVSEEGCTGLFGVPTMFIAVLEHPHFDHYNLTRLRTGVMAGAPCPVELMKQVVNQLHLKDMTICYGMTETSPVSFQTTPFDTLERRVSTVGQIHPHVQAKVILENGQTAPVGITGELVVRGYSVMQGYWDEPEQSQEVLDTAGWMHTGDLATLDAEGYCNIVGRVKDMVIRGGENIYPREIEEFLHQHPAIQNVQCFGIPDEKYGEVLCAWVQLKQGQTPSEAELKAYCEGQIAHYKVPAHIRFVEEYPMTISGKIQKYKMREEMRLLLEVKEITTA